MEEYPVIPTTAGIQGGCCCLLGRLLDAPMHGHDGALLDQDMLFQDSLKALGADLQVLGNMVCEHLWRGAKFVSS